MNHEILKPLNISLFYWGQSYFPNGLPGLFTSNRCSSYVLMYFILYVNYLYILLDRFVSSSFYDDSQSHLILS